MWRCSTGSSTRFILTRSLRAAGRAAGAGRPRAPSLLDFGADQFFEKHLAHIGGRPDVWYVPLGPLYAYQIVREDTVVTPLGAQEGWERFAVHNTLDPMVYDGAVTLTFVIPAATAVSVRAGGRPLSEKTSKLTDRWNVEYYRRDAGSTLVTVRPNQIVELRVGE
jgi:hypothetical protein